MKLAVLTLTLLSYGVDTPTALAQAPVDLPVSAAALPLGPPAAAPLAPAALATPTVLFEDKFHRVDKLPDDIRDSASEAIAKWTDFAEEQDFSMALSDDQALLFLSSDKPQMKARLKLVHEAQDRTEVLLYGPSEAKVRKKARSKGKVPEVTGSRGPAELPADAIPDHRGETISIFEFKSRAQLKIVLARLASEQEYIKSWLAEADSHSGFTFEHPLVGAWLETTDQEEWDPRAELINRTSQLLLLREYGTMPWWLRMGVAWNIEHAMLDGLWCFPFRSEFVFVDEHGAWPNEIQTMFEDRDEYPVQPDEFIEWPLQTYNGQKGRVAFGMIHFLAEHHAEDLPKVFEAIRVSFLIGQTEVGPNDAWKRKPNYSLGTDEQLQILIENTRDDLMPQATTYFRKKLRYKPR